MSTSTNINEYQSSFPKLYYISYLGYGLLKERSGHFDKAIFNYEKACNIITTNHKVHYKLGGLYFKNNDLVMALEHYEKAIKHSNKRNLNYQLSLAEIYLLLDKTEDALGIISTLPSNIQHWKAQYLLGLIEFEDEQYDEAIHYYKQSLDLYESNEVVTLALAKAYLINNSYSLALNYLEKTLILNPTHMEALYLSGYIYYQNSNFQKCIQFFEKIIKVNITFPDLLEMTAIAYWNVGQYNKCEALLLDVYTQNPQCPQTLANIAAVNGSLGRYEQAITHYLELTDHGHDNETTLNNLAWCYEQTNQTELAEKYHLQAIRCNPENFHFVENYINFLVKHKRFPQAIYSLQSYLERYFNKDAWLLLGSIFDTLNSHQQAVDCYNTAYGLPVSC